MNRAAWTTSSSWSSDELAERAACLLHRGLRPEPGCRRLLGGPRRARARADLFDLVVVACPPLAVERRRSVGPELVGGIEAERPHQTEVGADRRRGRRREPDARDRRVRRRVGHRCPEAVVGRCSDQQGGDARRRRRRRSSSPGRQGSWRATPRTPGRGSSAPEPAGSGRGRVGGRGHGRLGRRACGRVDVDRERLVPALDRHHRVVDGDRHVREDRVALGRREPRRLERLRADRVPVRDIGVRWARTADRLGAARRWRRRAEHDGREQREGEAR